MAVRIRLRRIGAKKQPYYRIVVADGRFPADGRFLEEIGYYDPNTEPSTVKVDVDAARKWLGVGALPSDTVARLFKNAGIEKGEPQKVTQGATQEVTLGATDE